MHDDQKADPKIARRQEIFQALVEAQDRGLPVLESYKLISEKFDINSAEIRHIEREGIEALWHPLE